MMRLPIAAWIGTSNSWRGISSLQLLGQLAALYERLVAVRDERERVHRRAVHEDVELDQIGLLIAAKV